MRQDQFDRLATLSEKLTETLLLEAEPAEWPGEGKKLADLNRNERGDRYWCKKNAMATLSILTRVHVLTNMVLRAGQEQPPADPADPEQPKDDLDGMIRAAEKEAKKILDSARPKGRSN